MRIDDDDDDVEYETAHRKTPQTIFVAKGCSASSNDLHRLIEVDPTFMSKKSQRLPITLNMLICCLTDSDLGKVHLSTA